MTRDCEKNGDIPKHCLLSSEQAADKAVKKVFAILGVDVEDPQSVEDFKDDLRFGRQMRKYANHSAMVMVGAISLGVVYAIYEGIVSSIKGVIH